MTLDNHVWRPFGRADFPMTKSPLEVDRVPAIRPRVRNPRENPTDPKRFERLLLHALDPQEIQGKAHHPVKGNETSLQIQHGPGKVLKREPTDLPYMLFHWSTRLQVASEKGTYPAREMGQLPMPNIAWDWHPIPCCSTGRDTSQSVDQVMTFKKTTTLFFKQKTQMNIASIILILVRKSLVKRKKTIHSVDIITYLPILNLAGMRRKKIF